MIPVSRAHIEEGLIHWPKEGPFSFTTTTLKSRKQKQTKRTSQRSKLPPEIVSKGQESGS